MCEFCEANKPLEEEYNNYDVKIMRIIPMPPINLTTGKYEDELEPPYYTLDIYDSYNDDHFGEIASIPIKYCPICGRYLLTGKDLLEWYKLIQRTKENK